MSTRFSQCSPSLFWFYLPIHLFAYRYTLSYVSTGSVRYFKEFLTIFYDVRDWMQSRISRVPNQRFWFAATADGHFRQLLAILVYVHVLVFILAWTTYTWMFFNEFLGRLDIRVIGVVMFVEDCGAFYISRNRTMSWHGILFACCKILISLQTWCWVLFIDIDTCIRDCRKTNEHFKIQEQSTSKSSKLILIISEENVSKKQSVTASGITNSWFVICAHIQNTFCPKTKQSYTFKFQKLTVESRVQVCRVLNHVHGKCKFAIDFGAICSEKAYSDDTATELENVICSKPSSMNSKSVAWWPNDDEMSKTFVA
jgi:hypothetical protein